MAVAYCTSAQIQARLPALGPTITADPTTWNPLLAEAISWAQSEIDFPLSARYIVPFTDPVPVPITHLAADLAAAFVLDSSFSGGGEERDTPLSRTLKARAQAKLDQLLSGKIVIPGADITQSEVASMCAYHSRPMQRSRVEPLRWTDTYVGPAPITPPYGIAPNPLPGCPNGPSMGGIFGNGNCGTW